MHQLPESKFVHKVCQQSPSVYAATVTVILAMIAALLFVVPLLPMHIWYTNGTDDPVESLNAVSIYNFVIVLLFDFF